MACGLGATSNATTGAVPSLRVERVEGIGVVELKKKRRHVLIRFQLAADSELKRSERNERSGLGAEETAVVLRWRRGLYGA